MLGQPVTRELIAAGFSVHVVARNTQAAQRLFPEATVVFGDLAKPESLPKALAGVDAVYLNLSVRQTEKSSDFHTETDGMKHVLTAAKAAGIQRIGYLSSIAMRYQGMNGFDWWAFRIKHEAVRLLKESGLDYSIFYPSNFMETMLTTQRMGPLVLVVGNSPVKPWFISAREYGQQVARAFQVARPGQPQEYVIQGPQPLTQKEAARKLTAHYTKSTLRVVIMPPALLRFGRLFSPQADYGLHISKALNHYPEQFEAEKTWADLGKPETTVSMFARSESVCKDTVGQ